MKDNNEFTGIARELFQKEPEQRFKMSIDQAAGTNPDQFAEAFNLSQEEVLPVDTVERNMDDVKKRNQRKKIDNEYSTYLKDNPKLVEFLQVPENARLSYDEIDKLGFMERKFKTFGKAFEQGVSTNILGRTYYGQQAGWSDFDISQKQIDNLDRILADAPDEEFSSSWLYEGGKMLGQFADMGARSITAGTGAAGIAILAGQAGPQALTPEEAFTAPTAFIAASTAAIVADSYMINAAFTHRDLTRIEQERGEKFDPLVKNGASALVGLANAFLEFLGVKYATAPFRQAFKKFMAKEGTEILVDQTRAKAVKEFAKNYAKAVGAETTTEIMQEGVSIFAEQVAQSISFDNFQNLTADPKQAEEALDRILQTGISVFKGMALVGLAGPTANFTVDYGKARKAQKNKDMMLALGEDAQSSKLLQRVPAKYREFIAAAKGQTENIYIDAEQFQTYFQSKGVDPNQVAAELGVDSQISEALSTGGDLVIPLENYAEKMAASEYHQELIPSLKFSPDDFTAAQADEFNASVQEVLQEQYQIAEQKQFDEARAELPSDRVYQDVFSQLRTAGRSVDVAEREASLWKAFFKTMGERTGTDAYSLFQKQNVSVTRELPAGLQAKSVTELDLMIEKFRSYKGQSQKKLFGDSLLEFVNKQGGVNASDVNAGDLVAQGIEDWHKEKKFRPRVLREKGGQFLDDLALAAWENGYFPEFQDRPSINDLLDKIDSELRGNLQFSEVQGDNNLQAEAQQIADLDQFFSDIGVDTNTMTNDEIKQAILEFEQGRESGGREFFQGEVDEQRASELTKEAIKLTGTTQVPEEAGYITRDGSMLDLSGRFYATGYNKVGNKFVATKGDYLAGNRSVDHREVSAELMDDGGTDGMVAFMNEAAAIRVDFNSGYINANVIPNAKQISQIVKAAKQAGLDSIEVEFDDMKGNTSSSATIEKITPANIKKVFETSEIGQSYFQDTGDKRGSFTITDTGDRVVKLFEKADLSTFLHESGHFFLEVMGELSAAENTPQSVKDDYASILKFLEVESADQIQTEQHEKFARAFEAYAFEGKAPSVELQSAFRRFRQWLVNVYKNIRNLNVTINDDLRQVFDRMLATEEEIQVAEDLSQYAPVLKDKETGGMTQEEYQAYLKSAERATYEAENDLLKKAMNEIKRERLEWYKNEKAKVREQMLEDVMQQPVYQALHYLQKGELFDRELPDDLKGMKLNSSYIENQYGKEGLKLLPKSVPPIYKKGGAHPDTIAEIFGFDSGDALIKSLWNAHNINALVEEKTNEEMKLKHGDMLNDGSIQEEAIKSIRSDERATFLLTELKALGKRANRVLKSPKEVAKAAAERFVAETQVKDLQLGKYASAEVKAARLAQQAVADGDFNQAVEQKRKQLFNHYLFIEARKSQDRVEKVVKYMNKFNKQAVRERLGKAGGGYLERIETLLERFDFRKSISTKAALRRESLVTWVEKQRSEGKDVVIDDALLDEAYRKPYKLMTTEELFGLDDTVRNIEHLARTKNKLLASKDAREFNEVVDDIVKTIEDNNELADVAPDFARGVSYKIKKGLKYAAASHVKPEFLFQQLDGDRDLGSVWTALFKPLADAETAEQDLMRQKTKELNATFDKNYTRLERAKWYIKKIYVSSVNKSFNKAEIISLALNWGNEGNRQAIRDGYGWSDAQVRDILDNLKKKDWQLVQDIWNIIDSLWPQSRDLHKDITGIAPPKVEATSVETKHGTFKGGYYPLKYDADQNYFAFRNKEKESTQELFGSNFIRPATKTGHLQERVGSAGQQVLLDLSVATEHVVNAVHDITHRKALIDVDRLVNNNRVRDAIERAAGKEMYRQLRPWLVSIAGEKRQISNFWEAIIGRARAGATVVNMAWKITTAIVQPLGYLQSVDLIGEKYAMKGLEFYGRNPLKMKKSVEFVMERSIMMQNRQRTYDRDVRDVIKKTSLKGPTFEIQQSFFYFIGLLDMGVSVPTWLGAYSKAMDGAVDGIKAGDELKAIDFADKTVRMSQSAGGAKDLASIQRGSEYSRAFTMFYSYFNVLYNLMRRRLQITKGVQDMPRFAASMLYLWFAPAILSELVAGRGPDDEDEWAEWAAKNLIGYPFSTVVGVRDISNAYLTEYDYEASPAFDAIDKSIGAFDIPYKLATGEDIDRSDVKDLVLATGYWGKLPARQTWITGEYLYDYATGEEDDFNFKDLFFARNKK